MSPYRDGFQTRTPSPSRRSTPTAVDRGQLAGWFVDEVKLSRSSSPSRRVDEVQQQATDFFRLLLLNPMSRTINEMCAAPLSTSRSLHPLKCTGKLIHTPIALACNETRRHIDGAARKRFKLGDVFAGKASIPLQAALKSGSSKFVCIHGQFCVSEPSACSNLLRRWHVLGRGLCHPLAEVHDVIGRHFRQLTRSEGGQLEWLVLFPISTLVIIIGTQESVDALRGSPHIIIGFARSVILLVMLPWRIEPRQVLENAGGARRNGRRKLLGSIKRQLRRASEWSTHQCYGSEHIR